MENDRIILLYRLLIIPEKWGIRETGDIFETENITDEKRSEK